MMEIIEYDEKYAKQMSDIILSNLYTINIKDYGKDVIDNIAIHFTASIYGLEFYRKLGYNFYKGINKKNQEGEYILSKVVS